MQKTKAFLIILSILWATFYTTTKLELCDDILLDSKQNNQDYDNAPTPSRPYENPVTYLSLASGAEDIFVSGNFAYIADGSAGLAIVNISNPKDPGDPIYKGTISKALGVYVSGDFAYLADENSGLAIINISDPMVPGDPIYQPTLR